MQFCLSLQRIMSGVEVDKPMLQILVNYLKYVV